jgi:SAM-dependent methyltransferase
MAKSIDWYDLHAHEVAPLYESIDPADSLGWLPGMIQRRWSNVVDIGAGTGRDAAWLASLGHSVVAVEPSIRMRAIGRRAHSSPRIHWMTDHLPQLARVGRLNVKFDLVLLSAVWMHVEPIKRPFAFRQIAAVLDTNGIVVVTLRFGPVDSDRGMHPVSVDELKRLAGVNALTILNRNEGCDQLGRPEVRWIRVVIGSGARGRLTFRQNAQSRAGHA